MPHFRTCAAVSLPFLLACSGLTLPDALVDALEDKSEEVDEAKKGEAVDEAEEVAQTPAPATPESLFTALDGEEAPAFVSISEMTCPEKTTKVRHPKGSRLNVYCAAGNGTRTGPYGEWAGSSLRETGTYVDGKFDGPYAHWKATGDKERPFRKVLQQTYAAGVLQGDLAEWDTEGTLLIRGAHAAGKRNGRFLEHTVTDGAVTFGGACYAEGTENWRTDDAEVFVSKECAGADAEVAG